MDNSITASIIFRPICSKCKHIIYEDVDYIEYPVHSKLGWFKDYSITPKECPYCGIRFNKIEMPTSLPFYEREAYDN